MLGSTKRRDPRRVVVQLVGVRDPALRIVVGCAEHRISPGYRNRRQSGIEDVLAAIHHAGERLAARIGEYGSRVEPGVLHGQKGLVPGEAEAKLVQDGW